MIPADKKNWAKALFKPYLHWILRSDFHEFYFQNFPPEIPATTNLILAPSHASWWDGFFAFQLNEWFFQRDFYLLMLESSLKQFPFFQKLGACSIVQESPKEIIRTFQYLSELLNQKEKILLTVYPQGILLPDVQEIEAKQGLTRLKLNRPVMILPLYTKTEPLGNRKPSVFFRFGSPIAFETYLSDPQCLEQSLNQIRMETGNALLSQTYGTAFLRKS